MSRRNPVRLMLGLAIEVTAVVLGVSLLPKLPWNELAGTTGRSEIADERPTLAEEGTGAYFDQRPIVVNASPPAGTPASYYATGPVTPDPNYVEQRLDQAGQQLLSGVSTYLNRTAGELLQPAPAAPVNSFSPPANAYRY